MADNLQATPRNELLGLLSDAMYGGLDWMKDPRRTQQMQGLAGLLESTGIPRTTQRMAYGEPLTNIGRANVPLLKPETAEALMNVAPFAPAVGRLASRAVRATEGMPVGMSIKDVSKGVVKEMPQRTSLLDMTRTPSEAEIQKLSREDLIKWLQNNDPEGQYLDPTPNPSLNMHRTARGYFIEDADTGDVMEFADYNSAKRQFDNLRYANAEFPPMTLQEAQDSAMNFLRESVQPQGGAKVLQLKPKQIAPQPTALNITQQTSGLLDQPDLSYRSTHTAPGPDFGAPLHDLTGGGQMYPADVYSAKAAQYYGSGNRKADIEAFNLAKRVRGNPDAEVTMYRAVPKNADISAINAGDWVTLSKDYAKNHGESVLGKDYKILSQKVKAKDLWTNADSIQEFGYQPQGLLN
jgi:hypothetical protein